MFQIIQFILLNTGCNNLSVQQEENYQLGYLTFRLPEKWVLTNYTQPAYFPLLINCSCNYETLLNHIKTDDDLRKNLSYQQSALVLAGADTLYLDTMSSVYWLRGCFEGCHRFYHLMDSVSLDTMKYSFYPINNKSGGWSGHPYDDIPDLDSRSVKERDIVYVYNDTDDPGPSGIYFSGTYRDKPFNLYGFNLSDSTIAQLKILYNTIDFE